MAFGSSVPEITVNAIATVQGLLVGTTSATALATTTFDSRGINTAESPSSFTTLISGWNKKFPWMTAGMPLLMILAKQHKHFRRIPLMNAESASTQTSAADLGVGGILGSGLIAFLVIPSICVHFAPTTEGLVLKKAALTRDVSFYGISLSVLALSVERGSGNFETGILLLLIYITYIGVLLRERSQKLRSHSATSSFRERYNSMRTIDFESCDSAASDLPFKHQNPLTDSLLENDSLAFSKSRPDTVSSYPPVGPTKLDMAAEGSHNASPSLSVSSNETAAPSKAFYCEGNHSMQPPPNNNNPSDNSSTLKFTGLNIPGLPTNSPMNTVMGSREISSTPIGLQNTSPMSLQQPNLQSTPIGLQSTNLKRTPLLNTNAFSTTSNTNLNPTSTSSTSFLPQQPKLHAQTLSPMGNIGSNTNIGSNPNPANKSSSSSSSSTNNNYYQQATGVTTADTVQDVSSMMQPPIPMKGNTDSTQVTPKIRIVNATEIHPSKTVYRKAEIKTLSGDIKIKYSSGETISTAPASNVPSATTSQQNQSATLPQLDFSKVHAKQQQDRSIEKGYKTKSDDMSYISPEIVISHKNSPNRVISLANNQDTNKRLLMARDIADEDSSDFKPGEKERYLAEVQIKNETIIHRDSAGKGNYPRAMPTAESEPEPNPNSVSSRDNSQIATNSNQVGFAEEESTPIYEEIISIITKPLQLAIDYTCPDCRIFEPLENWYPLTFVSSFLWISIFSYFVTIVVDNWIGKDLQGLQSAEAFFGIVLVAIGAEVPDTINSCTVAARGYGSMGTSSCIGSQIANICLGLGLSWTMAGAIEEQDVSLGKNDPLVKTVAWIQLGNVIIFYGAAVVLPSILTKGYLFRREEEMEENNNDVLTGHEKRSLFSTGSIDSSSKGSKDKDYVAPEIQVHIPVVTPVITPQDTTDKHQTSTTSFLKSNRTGSKENSNDSLGKPSPQPGETRSAPSSGSNNQITHHHLLVPPPERHHIISKETSIGHSSRGGGSNNSGLQAILESQLAARERHPVAMMPDGTSVRRMVQNLSGTNLGDLANPTDPHTQQALVVRVNTPQGSRSCSHDHLGGGSGDLSVTGVSGSGYKSKKVIDVELGPRGNLSARGPVGRGGTGGGGESSRSHLELISPEAYQKVKDLHEDPDDTIVLTHWHVKLFSGMYIFWILTFTVMTFGGAGGGFGR